MDTDKKTVRIYGTAANLARTPPPSSKGVEVWLCNGILAYQRRLPVSMQEWTRWFNLHSREHMIKTYPDSYNFYRKHANGRPIYLQKVQPDIPTSVEFPRKEIQEYFATAKRPNRFFTCSACWMIALAIMEGFDRIELWGFELRDNKRNPGECFKFERPAFFYWVKQARDRGIVVTLTKEAEALPFLPGDPDNYTGLLYGYSTKAELDWDIATESFKELT